MRSKIVKIICEECEQEKEVEIKAPQYCCLACRREAFRKFVSKKRPTNMQDESPIERPLEQPVPEVPAEEVQPGTQVEENNIQENGESTTSGGGQEISGDETEGGGSEGSDNIGQDTPGENKLDSPQESTGNTGGQ